MNTFERMDANEIYEPGREGTQERAFHREADWLSLCSFRGGGQWFGIDTRKIREVVRVTTVQRVPLTPLYIGGVVPYRGEVLTTVSFSALLNLPWPRGDGWVLVIDGMEGEGLFGLVVAEGIGGVVTADRRTWAHNPSTLDERSKALFSGAFRMADGLLVQLDPERLRPEQLAKTGLFGAVRAS